ncbi:MAG: ATP-dependent DNA helicase [Dermatophilaceae bacterium]
MLRAAVSAIGGVERAGQVQMAQAVQDAIVSGQHLLVQAGTGTGKSLAYLVPAVAHAYESGTPVVVATATLALQAQIIDRDMPALAEAVRPLLGRRPVSALLKGRRNYLCVYRLAGGFPDDDEGALLSVGAVDEGVSRLGAEVRRLRTWAEGTTSGDRDELVPGVSERAWRQVSVSGRECLGPACPMREECFVEVARGAAGDADIVVTNHALLAIDAFESLALLPEHDVLIVDEAHELMDRVTTTVSGELAPGTIASAVKKARRLADTDALTKAGEALGEVLAELPEGRITRPAQSLVVALGEVLQAARSCVSGLKPEPGERCDPADGSRAAAKAAVDDVYGVCERLLAGRELDVVWISDDPQRGPMLRVAPLSVAGLLRDGLFSERTTVLTSATLALGGSFEPVAGMVGLCGEGAPAWQGLDVGSPFDYPGQGIAYVAASLPAPGRDGTSPLAMDELEALIRAAGGRTLGLFSSMRAARAAAEEMRSRLGEDYPVLCQGDDQTPTLVRGFARQARTCLFGTLSLWQGVDVPGSACQLVVIDRIPFPRPDDPLMSARAESVARHGGNGFMAVSATHAALRLAQGAGRLIRRGDDRGVVAFLDPRMVTARYAGFLQRSVPSFWPTTDRDLVLAALKRLDATAEPTLPVREPGRRRAAPGPGTTAAGEAAADPPGVEIVEPAATDQDLFAPPFATGAPVADADRTGVTGGHPWSSDADEELRDGAELGLDLEELAGHLSRPTAEVAHRLQSLGLGGAAEGET